MANIEVTFNRKITEEEFEPVKKSCEILTDDDEIQGVKALFFSKYIGTDSGHSLQTKVVRENRESPQLLLTKPFEQEDGNYPKFYEASVSYKMAYLYPESYTKALSYYLFSTDQEEDGEFSRKLNYLGTISVGQRFIFDLGQQKTRRLLAISEELYKKFTKQVASKTTEGDELIRSAVIYTVSSPIHRVYSVFVITQEHHEKILSEQHGTIGARLYLNHGRLADFDSPKLKHIFEYIGEDKATDLYRSRSEIPRGGVFSFNIPARITSSSSAYPSCFSSSFIKDAHEKLQERFIVDSKRDVRVDALPLGYGNIVIVHAYNMQ